MTMDSDGGISLKLKVNWRVEEKDNRTVNIVSKVGEFLEEVRVERMDIKLGEWSSINGVGVENCDEIARHMFAK